MSSLLQKTNITTPITDIPPIRPKSTNEKCIIAMGKLREKLLCSEGYEEYVNKIEEYIKKLRIHSHFQNDPLPAMMDAIIFEVIKKCTIQCILNNRKGILKYLEVLKECIINRDDLSFCKYSEYYSDNDYCKYTALRDNALVEQHTIEAEQAKLISRLDTLHKMFNAKEITKDQVIQEMKALKHENKNTQKRLYDVMLRIKKYEKIIAEREYYVTQEIKKLLRDTDDDITTTDDIIW